MVRTTSLRPIEASAVLFDLDGTLIDSIGHFWHVTSETFRRVGLPVPTRDLICMSMRSEGRPFDVLVPETIENREALLTECQKIAGTIWSGMQPVRIDLIPGTEAAIRSLAARGVRLGIATASFGSWMEELLHHYGLRDFFGCLVSARDVPRRKPAPDVLLEALRRIDRPAEAAVYVGDSPLDIAAARAAGMLGVGVLSGISRREDLEPESPHAIIDSVAELADIIRGCA